MTGALFLLLTAIVLVAGLLSRRRVRRSVEERDPVVADEFLRTILDEEELRALEESDPLDEEGPLDEEEIRRAEDEFWAEENGDAEDWKN